MNNYYDPDWAEAFEEKYEEIKNLMDSSEENS